MGFPRQDHWSRLSFPSLGDLPDLGIELAFSVVSALAGRFFTTGPSGKPLIYLYVNFRFYNIMVLNLYSLSLLDSVLDGFQRIQ